MISDDYVCRRYIVGWLHILSPTAAMFFIAAPVVLSALASTALSAPYVPKGGLGTNSTPPVYNPMSDFDYQSLVRNF